MKEQDLVKAIGDIDERYVIEAAEAAEDIKAEKKVKPGVRAKRNWKPWVGALAAVFALCIGIGSFGNGYYMGGSSKSSSSMPAESQSYYVTSNSQMKGVNSYGGSADLSIEMDAAEPTAEAEYVRDEAAVKDSGSGASQPLASNVKLIKRAYLEIQTTDFDETRDALMKLVQSYDGYIENSSVWNGGYYGSGLKSGSFTVRVPADRYSSFVNGISEGYHVSRINESIDDIGQQYFDTETRLNTLKIKLERLQDLLKKASNMSDIITLESEIADTEYQIDSYTSTLNRYDSLVGYATINVELNEVSRVGDGVNQDPGFFARLARSLRNGALNFADSIGELINWAAYNAIGIIIIIAVIVIVKRNNLVGKLFGKFRKNKDE
ncbi:MAG: DUF4349 domain-containing protein [Firmicutes bacterium]|nr:DUF4349 domain-containing protein [Bacillota bacterium]